MGLSEKGRENGSSEIESSFKKFFCHVQVGEVGETKKRDRWCPEK